MRMHYIDPAGGDDRHDGLSPLQAVRRQTGRGIRPGDRVLYKRGSVIRGQLDTCAGSEDAPVTYGAYGDGENPIFLGSVASGDPADWTEVRPNVWRHAGGFSSEVCNLVFNGGVTRAEPEGTREVQTGVLRWDLGDLKAPGEWYSTGIGIASGRESWGRSEVEDGVLYLYAEGNPGCVYHDIEAVLWGQRRLVEGQNHLVLENLSFRNSGVHGFHGIGNRDVTIRDCDFRHIGGAVWHLERRIRFGNAIEFWDGAWDITVEGCTFDTIYDSGVTHQGGETRNIPARLYFRHNRFKDCGMASYECREPSEAVYFEHNACILTGGGFGLQGEPPPRQSEIYPQPMGHHVFIWRMEPGTQPGRVAIRYNRFGAAPHGAAIYSIIDPKDERQFVFGGNTYSGEDGARLARWGGHDYRMQDFPRYQAEIGETQNS